MQFSKVMYFIFTCLHFIQYIHYGTAMAADVRRRSGLDLYFTPPPLGLELGAWYLCYQDQEHRKRSRAMDYFGQVVRTTTRSSSSQSPNLKISTDLTAIEVVEAAAPDHPLFLPPSSRITGLSHQSWPTYRECRGFEPGTVAVWCSANELPHPPNVQTVCHCSEQPRGLLSSHICRSLTSSVNYFQAGRLQKPSATYVMKLSASCYPTILAFQVVWFTGQSQFSRIITVHD